jgi:hypothetical protein
LLLVVLDVSEEERNSWKLIWKKANIDNIVLVQINNKYQTKHLGLLFFVTLIVGMCRIRIPVSDIR